MRLLADRMESEACRLRCLHQASCNGYTLGSLGREKGLRKKLKARMNRWHPSKVSVVGNIFTALFEVTDINHVRRAIDDLDRTLDTFMENKLQPKEVEEILGITSLERIRWVKDDRLSKSGTGSFRKGQQVFQFYLHPVDAIASLAGNPAIIAGWREAYARENPIVKAIE